MKSFVSTTLVFATTAAAAATGKSAFSKCPAIPELFSNKNNAPGLCPQDFAVIGKKVETVHESKTPPTGLAVDPKGKVYLTYPRNQGPTPINVAVTNSLTGEKAWPNEKVQNCTEGQNPAECFVNIQNIVLDSKKQLWLIDSGIPAGQKAPVSNGSKLMSYDLSGNLLRTYVIPDSLHANDLFANDVRINNTLGTKGFAFIADESAGGSLLTVDLDTGNVTKRLTNSPVTRADPNYISMFNGEPVYAWNGTNKTFIASGANGIALASGNVYWAILSSKRFYYIPQQTLINPNATDEQLLAAVQDPGYCGVETAGLSADENGRLYITAGEANGIFYVDTQQSHVTEEVNGVPAGGNGTVAKENYVVKTLVRSGLIQHADTMAIMDGWLYFSTNQLGLAPFRQYKNVDKRKGPFRSFRTFIGAGPAI